jgi:hypothetical protein
VVGSSVARRELRPTEKGGDGMGFMNLLRASGAVSKILASMAVAAGVFVHSAPAAAETTREIFPFDFTITDCGNTIQVSGDVVATFHVVERASGGSLFAAHFVPRQIRGTDELGRRYITNGLTREMFIETPAGGNIHTFINRFHFVGTRGAPTFSLKETFHVRATPSGKIDTLVDKVSVACV